MNEPMKETEAWAVVRIRTGELRLLRVAKENAEFRLNKRYDRLARVRVVEIVDERKENGDANPQ